MSIGTFEKLGDGYIGGVILLGTETRVRIEPVTEKTTAKSPDFHLIAKERVGAAWARTSKKNTQFLSVAFDDLPTVSFSLFQAEGNSHDLVQRKPKKQQ